MRNAFHISLAAAIFTCGLLSQPQISTAQDEAGKNQAAIRDFNATAALQNSGFYERAAVKWQEFLAKYPKDERLDRVTYYLGVCQLHQKKYPEAVATFQAVQAKYPKFKSLDGAQYNLAMAQYQMAVASQKPADYQAAAKSFGDTVAKYAQSTHAARASYFQGEALYAAGELEAAAAAYAKVIASYGTSSLVPEAYYALGTTQQELGKSAEAAQTFQKFLADANLQKHSLANEIRLRLGMSLYADQKYADAEKQFQPVSTVENFPFADFATLRYGNCRMEQKDLAGAVTIFADLEKRFPESPYKAAAQLAAGRCLFQTDKFAEASQKLQPLADANQVESIEAAYWLGRALLKDNKAPQAVAALNKVNQSITQGPLAKLVNDAKAAKDEATLAFVPYVEMTRIDALYEIPEQRKETIALYDAFFKQYPAHPLAPQAQYMSALVALGENDHAGARTRAEQFLANKDALFAESELVPAVLYIAAEGYLLEEEPPDPAANIAKAEQYYRQLVAKAPDHARAPRANLRIGWCVYQAKKYDAAIQHLTAVLPALKEPEQKAEAELLIGRSHAEMKRDKEAVAAYNAALQAAPNWDRGDEVLLAVAQSFVALEDSANATQRLEQLITKFAETTYRAQAVYQLGELAQGAKDYDKAIARYNEVLQKDPQSEFAGPAQYGLGAVNFAKEDYPKALDPLNKLLAGKPDEETAKRGRYLRGLVFQRLKQYDAAVQDLQYYLTNKPEGDMALDAQYALAICQIGLKQFDPASQTLAALLAAKPDYEHADKVYYEMGHAYLALDEQAKAADSFAKLVAARPDSPLAAESWFHVGHFHEQTADAADDTAVKTAEIAKAADAYRQGVAKSKEDALREKLQYKLGDMLFRQEKFDEASKLLLAQVAAFPKGELAGPGRFLAAECMYQLDQFEPALPLFEQVAADKVEKYQDQALYRAGTCAKNLNRWDVSLRDFDALIKTFPKFEQISEARFGMGLALENLNRKPEAVAVYEQVTKETEAEAAARARFRIGGIAFGDKKYAEAIEHYLLVAFGYPYKELQADAHYEAARCMVELGQKDKAILQYEQVIKKLPDSPRAKDAALRIADLKK